MASSSSSVSGLTSSTGTSSICGSGSGSGDASACGSSGSSGSGAPGSKLGSDQRSKTLTSLARMSSLAESLLAMDTASDHFFAALAAEDDFPGFGHAAGDGEDFLLRRLHVADAYRPLGLQVVAKQFGGTLGHVLEDLFL